MVYSNRIIGLYYSKIGEKMEDKKREAVYNPKADKKWKEKNKEHRNYLSGRGAARSFIRNRATIEDLEELKRLINKRIKELKLDDVK